MKVRQLLTYLTTPAPQLKYNAQFAKMFLPSEAGPSLNCIDHAALNYIIRNYHQFNINETLLVGNRLYEEATILFNSRFEKIRELAPQALLLVHDQLLKLVPDLNSNEDAAYLHEKLNPITREIPREGVVVSLEQ